MLSDSLVDSVMYYVLFNVTDYISIIALIALCAYNNY